MRQSACLVINLVKVEIFAELFYCTPVDQAPDPMIAPTLCLDIFRFVCLDRCSFVCRFVVGVELTCVI